MERPPRPRALPLLDRGTLLRLTGAGSFSAGAAFLLLVTHPGDFEHARWVAFTTLVVAQAVRAYANRSLTHPVYRLGGNFFLAIACLSVVGVQAAIPFIPFLADAFRAVPLSASEWLLVAAVAVAPAVVAEVVRSRGSRVAWVA